MNAYSVLYHLPFDLTVPETAPSSCGNKNNDHTSRSAYNASIDALESSAAAARIASTVLLPSLEKNAGNAAHLPCGGDSREPQRI